MINTIINTDVSSLPSILRLFIKLSYVLMKVVLQKGSGSFIDTYCYEWNIFTINYVFLSYEWLRYIIDP
jgi:hypothetical protein